jgi:hypothetical protein
VAGQSQVTITFFFFRLSSSELSRDSLSDSESLELSLSGDLDRFFFFLPSCLCGEATLDWFTEQAKESESAATIMISGPISGSYK